MRRFWHAPLATVLTGSVILGASAPSFAQNVPGPADIGRIKPQTQSPATSRSADDGASVSSPLSAIEAPAGAKDIHFTLRSVIIHGATAFTSEQLSANYASFVGNDISLEKAYAIAEGITKQYRDAGYFLSLAYIPNQSIGDGVLTIQVVEGYIGKVEVQGDLAERSIVKAYTKRLQSLKPLKSESIESILLRMNDIPGYAFKAVLSAMPEAKEGAVKLVLVPVKKSGDGSLSFNNHSSRFLGPHQFSGYYSQSLLPFQQTSLSALTGLPSDKMKYGTLTHSLMVAADTTMEVSAGLTHSRPGFTLEPLDIQSRSVYVSASVAYQLVRQRETNLSVKVALDARNTRSDILGTELTDENTRAARFSAAFDAVDRWRGSNLVNITLSQGIDGLGSSDRGDINLSRAEARPDFTKIELSLSRLQSLTDDWSLLASASGQWASSPLFSSEEFGYGGQAFGRAFDASEITGDRGFAASMELRYGGWNTLTPIGLQPYAFADGGAVWNEDIGANTRQSGASAGFGLRAFTRQGTSGNIGIAWPLIRDVSTPIYGSSPSGPRLSFEFLQRF